MKTEAELNAILMKQVRTGRQPDASAGREGKLDGSSRSEVNGESKRKPKYQKSTNDFEVSEQIGVKTNLEA